MKIIVAHPAMDFDALASMLAAQKLYPDAALVTVGKPAHNVQDFMALHRESIQIRNYIDKQQVDTLILVDTRNEKRLQEYREVLDNEGLRVIIYDHHQPCAHEIAGAEIFFTDSGANVTQLVERIREQGLELSAMDATVMALGIYEDTGSLSYSNTTPRDLTAAAYLLEQGANLSVVANYIERPMNEAQQSLMNDLLSSTRIEKLNGLDVLFATAQTADFVGELSHLTAKLRDLHTVAAIFTIVAMGKRIYIVARSNTDRINVHSLLLPYGGGGHDRASSAVIKDGSETVMELKQKLIAALQEATVPSLRIRDIMTSPVKTIDCNTTMQEVEDYLLRYGHSGYPVMKDGELCGIVSRRDVEKAKYHGLGRLPVKGYMSHRVRTIDEEAPVEEAHNLMIRENIGRLPVMRAGELVGIVSRTDILRLLYGEKDAPKSAYRKNEEERVETLLPQMRSTLPAGTFQLLGEIASLADRENFTVFLVGGFVRDILLHELSLDLDLTVEGDGIAFAQLLAETFQGECTAYEKFGTAHVRLENCLGIDVASARTEFYEYPAALPQVENGTLRQDLYRRDFTINAMAISLNFRTIGRLVDYYNGKQDLEQKELRILHNLSFVEDPTRILRALRFAARYGMALETETERLARKAVADGVFEQLSFRRLWHEVAMALQEECPFEILKLYDAYGVWPYIFPNHPFDPDLEICFTNLETEAAGFRALEITPDPQLVWFLLLIYEHTEEELDDLFSRIDGRRRYRDAAYGLLSMQKFLASGSYLGPEQWYFFVRDYLMPEQVIAIYLRGDPARRAKILENYAAYCKIKVLLKRGDLKNIEGYEKSMYRRVIEDLAAQKLQDKLGSKEQEIAYVRQNIKMGKYD